MTIEDTTKIIAKYAAYLQGLIETPEGLADISEEDLNTLGEWISEQHNDIVGSVADYRAVFEEQKAQKAVEPVRQAVEAFIKAPNRQRIIVHEDSSETHAFARGTMYQHVVKIPRNGEYNFLDLQEHLKEQYAIFLTER